MDRERVQAVEQGGHPVDTVQDVSRQLLPLRIEFRSAQEDLREHMNRPEGLAQIVGHGVREVVECRGGGLLLGSRGRDFGGVGAGGNLLAGRKDGPNARHSQQIGDGALDVTPFTILAPDAQVDAAVSARRSEHGSKDVARVLMVVRMDELEHRVA